MATLGNFVLFGDGDLVKAAYLPGEHDWSVGFTYDGRTYQPASGEQIPLYDHLLNNQRGLVGFHLETIGLCPSLQRRRLVQARNVIDQGVDGTDFWILLTSSAALDVQADECAAMAAPVFSDEEDDAIVLVPHFDEWGKLWDFVEFELQTDRAPVAMRRA